MVKSLSSILETFWAMRDQRFLIQPYLEGGSEYRILICKNKVLGAIEKQ
jgi:glutathione synthase/RimK-type ligase-like ATP-grasp enzyme